MPNESADYYKLFPKHRDIYLSFYIPLLFPAILGNAGVVCLFGAYRDVRTTTNTFIASMATSDLIFGLGFLLWISKLFVPLDILLSKTYCLANFSLAFPMEHIGMWHIFIIALSRMVGLAWPYKHDFFFSKWKVRAIILLIWLLGSILGSLPLLGWNVWQEGKSSCFTIIHQPMYMAANSMLRFTVINLCILTYIALLVTSVKVTNRIRDDEQRMRQIVANRSGQEDPPIKSGDRDNVMHSRRLQLKVTRFILTITLVFVCCQLPKTTVLFMIGAFPRLLNVYEIIYVLNIGGLLNSAINPIIYCLQDPLFKTTFKKALYKLKISK